jgi:4-hydroxy-tetrahydrodipicolinate synthase
MNTPEQPANRSLRSLLQGLWLPLITPFRNGALDEASLGRLVRHYAGKPVDGLILAATSGEGMTLDAVSWNGSLH